MIFPFDIDNLNTHSLFSGTVINQDKPIMALYTNARVEGIDIKLILDSGLAGNIITKQLMDQLGCQVDCATTAQIITADGNTKTPIREIDNFPFKINGIQISIKVLITETIQYQALHAQVSAMCGYFKTQHTKEPLIEFENTPLLPTIETYQILSDEGLWNDVPDRKEICNKTCQYTILINDWVLHSAKSKKSKKICLYPNTIDPITSPKKLALTQKEQEQRLTDLNTKLCDYCLISCYFQYCDECNLMFDPPPRTLYPINKLLEPKEEAKLIAEDMPFQEPNKTTETEQYFYSDNNEGICPQKAHDTDAVSINLKIALEIPVSTMIQVASRSSLAKKKIDVKRGIINAEYTRNIIVMLQNNLDKSYKIESHNKIAQVIFLPLVKIPQLALVTIYENGRGNVPVNFAKEDSDQIELIYTDTIISILPYRQYFLKVNWKIQDQALLFEANPKICSLANIANLYLPAKTHKHFKISIHNSTKDVIEIPEGTLVSSISADIRNPEKLQSISDFTQLFLFCNITLQIWNLPKKSYLFTPEEINKLNLENLSTLQQMQLKVFLN
ncbi:hypothetical protein G9A89_021523 [Geosiphon pyriformis]|nr:hypothetical protein G9A89_021523 [Geosiphon pyriformis]